MDFIVASDDHGWHCLHFWNIKPEWHFLVEKNWKAGQVELVPNPKVFQIYQIKFYLTNKIINYNYFTVWLRYFSIANLVWFSDNSRSLNIAFLGIIGWSFSFDGVHGSLTCFVMSQLMSPSSRIKWTNCILSESSQISRNQTLYLQADQKMDVKIKSDSLLFLHQFVSFKMPISMSF